jgi:soluble lytic murein transglycosylase
MAYKHFIVLFLSFATSLAALDFKALQEYPRSLAKDFYIYRFLNEQNPKPQEAWELLTQTKRLNPKLLKAFQKHITEPGFSHSIECLYLDSKKFWEVDFTCKAIRISVSLFATFEKEKQEQLYKDLSASYPNLYGWMEPMLNKEPFESLLKSRYFLKVYTQSGKSFRQKKLNHPISTQRLLELSKEPLFGLFVAKVVYEKVHDNVAKSLLLLDPKDSNLSAKTSFLLGLNALLQGKKELAALWFEKSAKSAYYQSNKDKAFFWLYLVTQDEKYLELVGKSWDYNIYSIASREKLKLKPFEIIVPKAVAKERKHYSITDPFTWSETLNFISNRSLGELNLIAIDFLTKKTLPQYAFIKEKALEYKKPIFITPYEEYLKGIDRERKALIFAIARQESRFIPAAISTSYALGMMQFMPFLARDIAKKEGLSNFDLDQMFQPKIAYKFANIHLDYLTSWLFHPLFVAYAYNGGIGFTRSLLKRGDLFNGGRYEPFLSMELVPYAESREYGKKVLANYVGYKRILGQEVSIWDLFERLNQPDGLDRFRSSN